MWCIFLVLFGDIARQTDWMGGDSVLGPVNNWGTQYWISDSVTSATTGQVSLIATSWNYSNWVKHVIESNSGIWDAQGFMPADINGDGMKDPVAYTANEVVWYENLGNYNFAKHAIGTAVSTTAQCVYPCDLDQDSDIDVLLATQSGGVGWYENQGLSWTWHSIDNSTGYHRASPSDVELDGDLDIIACDNSLMSGHLGDIYLFRNGGTQNFTKELVANFSQQEGWRVYPQDFNGDGYPDIYSVYENTYIFLNDSTGHFTQSFYGDYQTGWDFDGGWPSDIDMDGDVDLIGGNYSGHHAWLNDGTGNNFAIYHLHSYGDYLDGTMVADIDLDGWPDIAGSYGSVGWFRQDPLNPLTFTLYNIDGVSSSHWLYVAPLTQKCIPSMDLLVTDMGAHIVYENQMLSGFANIGYLESSILEFSSDSVCTLKYFAYNACVPYDTALCFYWRAGSDSAGVVNSTYNGPYYATAGINVVDSFALSGTARMFQYKSEFRKVPNDIAVLYEIWLTYNCPPFGVEETGKYTGLPLQFINGKLVLCLANEDRVQLTIYDIAGRLAKNVFDACLPSGTYEFEVTKKPGIYFARFRSTDGINTLKFVTLK